MLSEKQNERYFYLGIICCFVIIFLFIMPYILKSRSFDSGYYDGLVGGGYVVVYIAIAILILSGVTLLSDGEPIFGMMSGLSVIMVVLSIIWATRIPPTELSPILSYHRWVLVLASFIVLMCSIWQWKTGY